MGSELKTGSFSCRSCGSQDLEPFLDMPDVPAYVNFLWDSEEDALACPRGRILLALCRHCALISNVTFEPDLLRYREGYENALHHSAVFREYMESLADALIARLDLRGKTIVEIGCGQGEFLKLLCERGDNRGIGFDPSYAASDDVRERDDRITIIKDTYDDRHANIRADFILSRQTLEHIPNPQHMLEPLRRSIGGRPGTPVFFEVPNATYTLRHAFVWDVIYEHPSYFTLSALETTLALAGFRVDDAHEAFGGQYLCATAYAADTRSKPKAELNARRAIERDIASFRASYTSYVDAWRAKLQAIAISGKSAALWGAGSKGVTFANLLDRRGVIQYIVDVNPKKHGKYLSGRGHRIVGPEHLRDDPVDAVIVANMIYRDEIAAKTTALGVAPEFLYL